MTRSSRPQSPESHPKRKSSPARAFSGAKDFDADLDPHAPSMTVTQPGPTGNAGLIFLLKTQLMLQTELRKQLERDLRSRDELVKDLEEKLAERELAKAVQLAMLKQCKTKVEELERSRQESMQRSIMDEASAESLRIALLLPCWSPAGEGVLETHGRNPPHAEGDAQRSRDQIGEGDAGAVGCCGALLRRRRQGRHGRPQERIHQQRHEQLHTSCCARIARRRGLSYSTRPALNTNAPAPTRGREPRVEPQAVDVLVPG
ncbi:hypothetical protein B0H14DRAFT_465326 [Mycena olivaceomarginata]|nr:hypothetical protein B0H14DRAFT_465326 [Mycena olivaceomarginata]